MKWFVYILTCKDGTLYTGVTNDIGKRVADHNRGMGAKYTRGRTPVTLIACIEVENRSEALSLEYQIKKMPRRKKLLEAQRWQEENQRDGSSGYVTC